MTGPQPAEQPKDKKKKGPSQATQLARLAVNLGVELFHDAENAPYATVAAGVTLSLKSKTFNQWLSRAFYNDTREAASASTLTDAINLLSASALYSGPQLDVHVRLAPGDHELWLDLGKQAVKITADGWEIVDVPTVRFYRAPGFLTLPTPVPTPPEMCEALLSELLNITPDDMPLITAWLLGVLRGRPPFPVLALNGDHGSAKSYGSKVLRSLLDPNIAPVRATYKDPRDMMIAASNGLIAAFDNLSVIPDWFSDAICCLATGAGFATRELHTDRDEVIFNVARPVLLNSITEVVRRPDLLDRSIVITLEPIPSKARRTERELNDRFRRLHPQILGALLSAAVVSLRHEATTTLPLLPRMADFATWVEAGAPAFGWEPESFLHLFESRRRAATADLMSSDMVVEALLEMPKPWSGTPTQLYRLLTTPDRQRSRDWPITVNALAARLRRLASPLREQGIELSRKRAHGGRLIQIAATGDAEAQGFEEF